MMLDELTTTGVLVHNTDKRIPPVPDTNKKQINFILPKSCSKICPINKIDIMLQIKCSIFICKNKDDKNRQI